MLNWDLSINYVLLKTEHAALKKKISIRLGTDIHLMTVDEKQE